MTEPGVSKKIFTKVEEMTSDELEELYIEASKKYFKQLSEYRLFKEEWEKCEEMSSKKGKDLWGEQGKNIWKKYIAALHVHTELEYLCKIAIKALERLEQ